MPASFPLGCGLFRPGIGERRERRVAGPEPRGTTRRAACGRAWRAWRGPTLSAPSAARPKTARSSRGGDAGCASQTSGGVGCDRDGYQTQVPEHAHPPASPSPRRHPLRLIARPNRIPGGRSGAGQLDVAMRTIEICLRLLGSGPAGDTRPGRSRSRWRSFGLGPHGRHGPRVPGLAVHQHMKRCGGADAARLE